MRKEEIIVGILGGMGPRSTAPFLDQVIDAFQETTGATHDIDFPKMLIVSQPTPFYLDRALDHKAMRNSVFSGLMSLEQADAAFVAMPCNTIHQYFEILQSKCSLELLNIVELTVRELNPKCPAALLATPSTVAMGLYQNAIAQRGISMIMKPHWQELVTATIAKIKAGQQELEEWQQLLLELEHEQIPQVISACTDLNVAIRRFPGSVQFLDSAQCLARATVRRYLELSEDAS